MTGTGGEPVAGGGAASNAAATQAFQPGVVRSRAVGTAGSGKLAVCPAVSMRARTKRAFVSSSSAPSTVVMPEVAPHKMRAQRVTSISLPPATAPALVASEQLSTHHSSFASTRLFLVLWRGVIPWG